MRKIENEKTLQDVGVNHKEVFMSIHKAITREGSDKLLEWVLKTDFFTAPASTKFHGNFEGGLLQHSLAVYDALDARVSALGLYNTYSKETVAIVALYHDLCKTLFYKKGTRNVKENGAWVTKEVYEIDDIFPVGHSEKSIILLQHFIKLTSEEIMAIRAHMGGFDTMVKGGDFSIGKIFEKSKLAVLLHLADMEATYIKGI